MEIVLYIKLVTIAAFISAAIVSPIIFGTMWAMGINFKRK